MRKEVNMKTNQPKKPLSEIAQEINRLHGEVQGLESEIENLQVTIDEKEDTAQEKAQKIGQLLVDAKKRIKHGSWLLWLKKNCPEINERTARQYMAFVRGDADSLHSGGENRSLRADGSDFSDEDLTDKQRKAIDLVKQGKSYRQIGKELDTDEANIRKDPIIRAVRQEHDPNAHSETIRESWAACRTLSVAERVEDIELQIEYLFDMGMYKIGSNHRARLAKAARRILKGLEQTDGK
jgi:hypothetical protein